MRGIALIVGALTLWSSAARALTVGVVRPPRPSSLAKETLFRVFGELRSLGLETRMLDVSDADAADIDEGPPSRLERMGTAQGTDALIALVRAAAPTAIEVWATDGRGRSVTRRLPLGAAAERAPQTIAIRAIELLRSSLLELDLAAAARALSPQAPPPPPLLAPQSVQAGGRPSRTARFTLGAGGAAVMSFDSVGLAVRPLLRFGWLFRPSWLIQGDVSGLGTRATVEGAQGSAQVGQDQALAGIGYRPLASRRLSPTFILTAGALHTVVEGHAVAGFESRRATQWSFLVDGAAGASLRLAPRLGLTAAAHLQLAAPYPAVRFVGETVATSAHPNLVFTLAAEVWL